MSYLIYHGCQICGEDSHIKRIEILQRNFIQISLVTRNHLCKFHSFSLTEFITLQPWTKVMRKTTNFTGK